ncbi:PTS mannose transporter subunit IIA [Clostridium polyendosporum]|uniref:PTS mannose transporter subunit IIA n=1 Tax=Clostridium polyendosporum TaxID=69208 RepID=A0A919VHY3_9CLOT|nr:PTS lactose/cellobiose transporter subunit IIA [Clostridium polyendosporum]GIM30211.1 PTS mannose transporter subunit IIA [Clostridium polyendosporum]
MNLEEIVMNIIIHSGEAKAFAYEALSKAKDGEFDEVEVLMEKANDAIGKAHDIQTSLLQKEASGDKTEVSILFVHAQDHLMTSMSEKNLISEIIELTKIVKCLSNKEELNDSLIK